MTNRTQLLAEAVVSAYIHEIAQPERSRPAQPADDLLRLRYGDVPPEVLDVEGREALAA